MNTFTNSDVVPVPSGFESATNLGPAADVHLSKHHGLLSLGSEVQALVLYRDGFAFSLGKGKAQSWTWDEIAVILSKDFTYSNAGVNQIDFQYTLEKKDGEKLVLNESKLEELNDAADAIKEKVYALLRPPFQEQYEAGQALTFGPLTVSKAGGLRADGRDIGWKDLLRLELQQGSLRITTKDSHIHQVKAAQIPNVEMVCQIMGMPANSVHLIY